MPWIRDGHLCEDLKQAEQERAEQEQEPAEQERRRLWTEQMRRFDAEEAEERRPSEVVRRLEEQPHHSFPCCFGRCSPIRCLIFDAGAVICAALWLC